MKLIKNQERQIAGMYSGVCFAVLCSETARWAFLRCLTNAYSSSPSFRKYLSGVCCIPEIMLEWEGKNMAFAHLYRETFLFKFILFSTSTFICVSSCPCLLFSYVRGRHCPSLPPAPLPVLWVEFPSTSSDVWQHHFSALLACFHMLSLSMGLSFCL